VSTQRVVYLILFCAMFIVWLAVVLTYHLMTGGRWRRSPEGRHVMIFGVLFTWNSGLAIANLIFGQYPGRFIIGVTSYATFILIGAQRLGMIVRAQHSIDRRIRAVQAIRAAKAADRTSSEPPR
jgi:hypothetical protein